MRFPMNWLGADRRNARRSPAGTPESTTQSNSKASGEAALFRQSLGALADKLEQLSRTGNGVAVPVAEAAKRTASPAAPR